jgi:hypothetical protein
MGSCFLLRDRLFCLSHCKPRWTMSVDSVGLKICLFGDLELHGHSDIFPHGVNQSALGTSSTTNRKFYMGLGQLHAPWCK